MEHRSLTDELVTETRHVHELHRLLAIELDAVSGRATSALSVRAGGELSARWERDVAVHRWSERAARLRAARSGLCFGRLDRPEEPPVYVGRIGLSEDDATALLDWRAPEAQPFYCATLANPMGLTRRRHLAVAGIAPDERVVDIHDDVFQAPRTGTDMSGTAADPALLAALSAPRGSSMRDIVATIQTEQDAVIRLPLPGTVVVEGGPGTGKTAVALHRVAYLLYSYRDQLARRGVLVVGPSEPFLAYVGGVLPALGESAVVFTTPGRLHHGLDATALDTPAVARTKGDLAMCAVLRAAVAREQTLPAEPISIALDAVTLDVDRAVAQQARTVARGSGRSHNAARMVFAESLVAQLVERGVDRLAAGVLADAGEHEQDRASDGYATDPIRSAAAIAKELADDLRDELVDHPGFRSALDALWPLRSAERVLAELLSSPERLAAISSTLRGDGRPDHHLDLAVLHRVDGAAWTVSDAPLLDELVEILGPFPRSRRRDRVERAYAAEVLAAMDDHDRNVVGEDADELRATDFVTADVLAERFAEELTGSVAERAAADREWTYGHLVVDEAQELSAMDWHVLARRCPSRSITAVGDLAQRSAPAGARTWAEVLRPVVGDRFRLRPLTVNYRTPAEIMEAAALVLPEDERHRVPQSVRRTGEPPIRVALGDLPAVLADAGAGTAAVITSAPAALPDLGEVAVHTPASAKGLEFDVVVVVDPEGIARHCPADLYVAMTRATRRLVLVP